jgi:predicted ATPase
MQRIFEALSSSTRREILAHLHDAELSAGEIASRFSMSKPSISQHLSVLVAAGLVTSQKRGQFVFYAIVPDILTSTLNGYLQEVCPVSRPLQCGSSAMSPSDRLHVITGGPGSGKSTLIEALASVGVTTSEEVGRRIIREQMAAGENAMPWGDQRRFAKLMLAGERAAHAAALDRGETVVLDRGVPDVAGFLRVSGIAVPAVLDQAARTYRYNRRVFLAPFWANIFTEDAERKQSMHLAAATESIMRATYTDYGYTIVELPRASVAERVGFVMEHLSADE